MVIASVVLIVISAVLGAVLTWRKPVRSWRRVDVQLVVLLGVTSMLIFGASAASGREWSSAGLLGALVLSFLTGFGAAALVDPVALRRVSPALGWLGAVGLVVAVPTTLAWS